MINFHQSKWNLDLGIPGNTKTLDSIDRRLAAVGADSTYRMSRISVFGGASPEGSVAFNRFLSEQRAATLFDWFSRYPDFSSVDRSFTFYGRDWEGVLRLAEADPALPYRDETIALLSEIVVGKREADGKEPPASLERMKQLRGGEPYRYLYRNIFPIVRASKIVIDFERVQFPKMDFKVTADFPPLPTAMKCAVPPQLATIGTGFSLKDPFYMAVYTNMLYDALAVPNVGVEFYLGKDWTVAANYMHAWWSYDPRHRYWRIYGGELNVRRWFGRLARMKPLTGHHLGVYIQALTYDFEWGGKAYMGGEPGGTIFDRAHFGAGIEYGYSLPVASRLNIDFSLGAGYIGGRVYEFIPSGGRYVWTDTRTRHWIGPTKLEIALVWLIGRGNVNLKKGGHR